MTSKKASYRVNFTMPSADSELNSKICELFERHREIGTLRHWLMSLATEAAREELGALPTSAPAVTPKTEDTGIEQEYERDLIEDDQCDGSVAIPPKTPKTPEALKEEYEKLVKNIRKDIGFSMSKLELDGLIEKHRPI